jgi:hypothetical protein
MGGFKTRIASRAIVSTLLLTPVASEAAPAPQVQQNSWVTLSMLTPSGAIGLAGTAAQPSEANNPAPIPSTYGSPQTPPIPVIGIWFATVAMAVYILAREHHPGRFSFPRPISAG